MRLHDPNQSGHPALLFALGNDHNSSDEAQLQTAQARCPRCTHDLQQPPSQSMQPETTASKAHVHTQGMLTCACGALGVCRGCQGLGALQHMAKQGIAGSADILVVS